MFIKVDAGMAFGWRDLTKYIFLEIEAKELMLFAYECPEDDPKIKTNFLLCISFNDFIS